MIPLHIYYDVTDKPWGGINSFFRAFKECINDREDCRIVSDVNSCKGLIMGANAYSRQKRIQFTDVKDIKESGIKVVHRLDGLRSSYTKNTSFMDEDKQQLELSNLADRIVFQSEFSASEFKSIGQINAYSIIHNGVNHNVFRTGNKKINDLKNLKILSVSWSSNINKGFGTIAKMSEALLNAKSIFVGNWCKEVDSKRVSIQAPLHRKYLVECYRMCDIFLHGAENDPCPNVVIEALSCGLPVIYRDSGGVSEIVRGCGVALPSIVTKKALRKAVTEVVDNYDKLLEKIRCNMRYFSIDYAVDKYIGVFGELLTHGK
jgi:glycosyltransferase involved in cell wall biosynthesis